MTKIFNYISNTPKHPAIVLHSGRLIPQHGKSHEVTDLFIFKNTLSVVTYYSIGSNWVEKVADIDKFAYGYGIIPNALVDDHTLDGAMLTGFDDHNHLHIFDKLLFTLVKHVLKAEDQIATYIKFESNRWF